MSPTIVKQSFDSDAFGIPFYRITELSMARLAEELPSITAARPVIIDAKVPEPNVEAGSWLLGQGFRKICTQLELLWPTGAASLSGSADGVRLVDELSLTDDELGAHARNFIFDRFSQDPALPRSGVHRLYERWIRNSTSGRRRVLRAGRSFFTFSVAGDLVRTDLLSVLDKRQGMGRRLVASLLEHARSIDARGISVITECENVPSWNLFMRAGFQLRSFQSVFHFVSRDSACDRP